MFNSKEIINAASILEVKSSGNITADLNLPEGKSIAELLHDQEKNPTQINPSEQCE